MKKIFTLFAAVLISVQVLAQAPQKMSYQAVIRNSSNSLVASTQVGMKISILQTTDTGTAVYEETQTPTTNANGLVSLAIGTGITTDNFAGIDWSAGPYFVKTETDPAGGTNYTITGSSQLMSVPFALYTANSVTTMGEFSSSSNAKGGTITSGVLNLTPADATNGGIVTNGAQTFVGDKTFLNATVVSGSSTANSFVVPNGTSSQFLKANGSIDSNVYIPKPAADGTTGQILKSNGDGTTTWSNATNSSYHANQLFTANGTFIAPSNVTSIRITMIAGGGSGGSNGPGASVGSGGQAGNYINGTIISVTPGQTYNITVGAGGVSTSCPFPWDGHCSGYNGEDSSFDTLLNVTGGLGGCDSCVFQQQSNGQGSPFGGFGAGGNSTSINNSYGMGASNPGNSGMVLIEYYLW